MRKMRGIEKVELIDKMRRRLWTLPGGMKTSTHVGFSVNEKEVEDCAAWLDKAFGDELGRVLEKYYKTMNCGVEELLQGEFVKLVDWLKTAVKIAVKKARLRRRLLRTLKPLKGYLTTKIIRNGVEVDGLTFEIKNEKDLKAVRSLLWQFRAQQNAPFEFFGWMVRRPQVILGNSGRRVVQTQRGPCMVTWTKNEEKERGRE